jgi:sugar phosphate isomerase/epimerase
MLHLSAFADEISPDVAEQARVCRENGVTHFELRSVDKVNVLDFDKALRERIRKTLADHGLGVVSIASPIGKVAIDKPWSEHLERFKIAVDAAEYFAAPFIRVFSYYPAGGEGKGPIEPHRDEVIRRFQDKIRYLEAHPGITLVHENEKGIYGDVGRRCLDLMSSVNSPRLRCAFDFANFVQVGERPIENWNLLKPYTAHIHIKDAKLGTGTVVPAGEGDGDIPQILPDAYAAGYRGFVSLEPHLKVAGHSHGETGPELFKVAADALKAILRKNNIPLAAADIA